MLIVVGKITCRSEMNEKNEIEEETKTLAYVVVLNLKRYFIMNNEKENDS